VADSGLAEVSVIDTSTEIVASNPVPVGHSPTGVAASPDGTHVYVTNESDRSVSAIDTCSDAVEATVTLSSFADPVGLAAVSGTSGDQVYVADTTGQVWIIESFAPRSVSALFNGFCQPWSAAASPDGTLVYVTNGGGTNPSEPCAATSLYHSVRVIDTSTNMLVGDPIPVDDGSNTSGQKLASHHGVAVSPDGRYVYVANPYAGGGNNGTVSVIDTSTSPPTVFPPVTVEMRPEQVAVAPDGSQVYVTNSFSDSLSVIDAHTRMVVDTVALPGARPWGVAPVPTASGLLVYVAAPGSLLAPSDKVEVIAPGGAPGHSQIVNTLSLPPGSSPKGVAVASPVCTATTTTTPSTATTTGPTTTVTTTTTTLATPTTLMAISLCPGTCANPRLGAAEECTILELSGAKVDLSGSSLVDGNVCLGSGGRLVMSGSARVTGELRYTSPLHFRRSGSASVAGGPVAADLSQSIADAQSAATVAAGLACTQTLPSLKGTQTIVGNGGLNVVCVGDVVLSGRKVVTLQGGPADEFVLNVSGRFSLSGRSQIRVAGDVQAGDVLYDIIGSGRGRGRRHGGTVMLSGNSHVDGTLLAIERKVAIEPGSVTGQIVSGHPIVLSGGASVRCRCPTP